MHTDSLTAPHDADDAAADRAKRGRGGARLFSARACCIVTAPSAHTASRKSTGTEPSWIHLDYVIRLCLLSRLLSRRHESTMGRNAFRRAFTVITTKNAAIPTETCSKYRISHVAPRQRLTAAPSAAFSSRSSTYRHVSPSPEAPAATPAYPAWRQDAPHPDPSRTSRGLPKSPALQPVADTT